MCIRDFDLKHLSRPRYLIGSGQYANMQRSGNGYDAFWNDRDDI